MAWLDAVLGAALPKPAIRRSPRRTQHQVRQVIVVARLPNPTFDYYLAARMVAPNMPPCRLVELRDAPLGDIDPDGAFIVVCRYMTIDLVRWIERNDERLAGVAYFTDDDVSAFVASGDAGLGYRLFLFWLALWPLRRLNRVLDQLWVSTPALARVFAHAHPTVLPPAPPDALWMPRSATRGGEERCRLVFHAKAIHETEHEFLVPVIREVLRLRPRIEVEINAEGRTLRHWQGLQGVTLVDEVPWPFYIEQTRDRGADIILVPLMPTRVNGARADTKRIDVSRAGAAGVFSRCETYGFESDEGEMLLDNDASAWIAAIIALIDDPALRARTAEATRIRVAVMSARAAQGLPGLSSA